MLRWSRLLGVVGLFFLSIVTQAQESTVNSILVGNTRVEKNEAQELGIYFTAVDGTNRAIPSPTFEEALFRIGGSEVSLEVVKPTTPLYLTFVLDMSGSMKNAPARSMRDAVVSALNIPQAQNLQVSLITFNDTVNLRQGFTTDRNLIMTTVTNLPDQEFAGGTCLYNAMNDAIKSFPTESLGRRAIVVFTDGRDEKTLGKGDTCSTVTPQDILNAAKSPVTRVPLYTIGMTSANKVDQGLLQDFATGTGGFATFEEAQDLTTAFRSILEAIDSQRLARTSSCLPTGIYAGRLEVKANGAAVGADVNNIVVEPGDSCIPATSTPTETPLEILVDASKADPQTPGNILITVQRKGGSDIVRYSILLFDADRNFAISLPPEYNQLLEITAPGETIQFSLPLSVIPAETLRVGVQAFNASGTQIGENFWGQEASPYRTATPTDLPPATTTLVPTLTPTATPFVVDTAIKAITYDPASKMFLLALDPNRMSSLNSSAVKGYIVRVTKDNLTLNEEQHDVMPEENITVGAFYTRTQTELPENEYIIKLQILTRDGIDLDMSNSVLDSEMAVQKPAAIVEHQPTLFDQAVAAIQANPLILALLCGAPIAIGALLLFFVMRGNSEDVSDSKSSNGDQKYDTSPRTAEGDKGVRFDQKAGPPQRLINWHFSLKHIPSYRYTIGRVALKPQATQIIDMALDDTDLNDIHARVRYDTYENQYYIVNESNKEIYVKGKRVKPGGEMSLVNLSEVKLGNITFTFQDLNQAVETPSLPSVPAPSSAARLLATLVVKKSPDPDLPPDTRIEIRQKSFVIGRKSEKPSEGSDLMIQDPIKKRIGRQHLQLTFDKDKGSFQAIGKQDNVTCLQSGNKPIASIQNKSVLLATDVIHTLYLGIDSKASAGNTQDKDAVCADQYTGIFVFELIYPQAQSDDGTRVVIGNKSSDASAAPDNTNVVIGGQVSQPSQGSQTASVMGNTVHQAVDKQEASSAARGSARANQEASGGTVDLEQTIKDRRHTRTLPLPNLPETENQSFPAAPSQKLPDSTEVMNTDGLATQLEEGINYTSAPSPTLNYGDETRVDAIPERVNPLLYVISNPEYLDQVEAQIPITDVQMSIGRRQNALKDKPSSVSRDHFQLRWEKDHFVILDTSTNGTLVDWVALPRGEMKQLFPGRRYTLQLGNTQPVYLTFSYENA